MIESLKLALSMLVSKLDVCWAAALEFDAVAPEPYKLIPLRSPALLLLEMVPPLFELIILELLIKTYRFLLSI